MSYGFKAKALESDKGKVGLHDLGQVMQSLLSYPLLPHLQNGANESHFMELL